MALQKPQITKAPISPSMQLHLDNGGHPMAEFSRNEKNYRRKLI
jgi:hypothetical protein